MYAVDRGSRGKKLLFKKLNLKSYTASNYPHHVGKKENRSLHLKSMFEVHTLCLEFVFEVDDQTSQFLYVTGPSHVQY